MPLKVIGAGYGRTGTLSLKLALEQLGFGPCYHMVEVFKNPEAPGWWIEAADGHPDWEKIFAGYSSTVDWPNATFYRELAEAYPDAKVILTERDPEEWFASTQATIFSPKLPRDPASVHFQMIQKVIGRLFAGRFDDHDTLVEVFKRHNATVREVIPPERLLVYEVAQGWKPLCDFLGVPVPEGPMPKANAREDFMAMFAQRTGRPTPEPAG